MRHASFFSGVGGLDLGFHRAGINTVSVSEIDPYASAVLAERFPDAPNLGNITEVSAHDIPEAEIWTGGFPCQDLSVAGKRAGFAGKRSSLAFTFLDLVEQRRPRWIVLENVPGLFTSNNGADFGRLLHEMEQLGYGVSWRVLDAQHFGVAQRRRRVFIVGSLESDRAGEVLLECEGCKRHPAPSQSTRKNVAADASGGVGGVGNRERNHSASATADADGVRETDGMARRVDVEQVMARKTSFGQYEMTNAAATLRASGGDAGGVSENLTMTAYQTRVDESGGSFTLNPVEVANSLSALWPSDTSHRSMTLVHGGESILSFPSRFGANAQVTENQAQSFAYSAGAPAVFRKAARAQTDRDSETWVEGDIANTLNSFDVGDVRTTHAVLGGTSQEQDELPVGLDGHRYRCCGNGVAAPVAEWIGRRLVEVDRRWREEVT